MAIYGSRTCINGYRASQFIDWKAFIFGVLGADEEDDYSEMTGAALDMVLNALALFFMLDLDDEMVTAQDYHDCANHLHDILDAYHADVLINKKYENFENTCKVKHKCCKCWENRVNCCGCCLCTYAHADIPMGPMTLQVSDAAEENAMEEQKSTPDNFRQWDSDQIVQWIIGLDDKYKEYAQRLREVFKYKK
eukprot:104861_1